MWVLPGVPALLAEGVPSLQFQIDCNGSLEGGIKCDLGGDVLGAPLGDDLHLAATDIEVEGAVGVEEWRARPDLEEGVARMREIPVGAGDLYSRLHRFAGRLVDDPSRQPSHLALLSCLVWGILVRIPFEALWYRKGGASGALGLAHGKRD